MLLELIIVKLYLFELITVHIFANVLSVFNFPYTKTICYFHLQIHFIYLCYTYAIHRWHTSYAKAVFYTYLSLSLIKRYLHPF